MRATTERDAIADKQLGEIIKRQESRNSTSLHAFTASLKQRPVANADIMFPPNDAESQTFSMSLYDALVASGWNVQFPVPMPMYLTAGDHRSRHAIRTLPPTCVSIVLREIPQTRQYLFERSTPQQALLGAFIDCKWPIRIGRDQDLSEDAVRLIVLAKPW